MSDFISFESLYNHLEENATDYKYSHQIGDLFQKLRDLKNKENKSGEAEKAQWEVDFFNFTIEEGRLKPLFTGTNDKGEVVEYPILDRFNDRTFVYLVGRLGSTSNPLLKARYSHILWHSPKKHGKYARIAVDSYLKLIKIYQSKDKKEPQEYYGLDVLKAFKNAYSIAYQVKYKIDKIKSELGKLITAFNFKSSSSFALRANLIRLMLKGKTQFSKEDFKDFRNICRQISDTLTKDGNIHASIQMLELGEKIDQKLEKKALDWREQIAKSYETLIKQAEKSNNLASLTFCQYALENYKKLRDKDKVNELEKKYSELKNSMKFTEFKKEIDLKEHVKRCREIAKKVVQNEPDKIIKVLMRDNNLLPRYEDIERIAIEHSKKFVLGHIASTEIMDQRGHPAQHFSDEDEKKYFEILRQYEFELELDKMHLINAIFFAAIRENKLSVDILLKFLNKHSWFGKNIRKKLSKDKTITYNWLNLIAPSLHEYFLQMHYYLLNPTNRPNLVLSIDSLTLKIEGLLRDICQFSGITTFYMTKDNKDRNIVREKGLHALLHEEPIEKLFNEDDLLLFKFLLVEKAGYNLRHKVAHSLMLFQEYSISYIHLLILALLKLGKYDFVKKENASSHNSG